MRTAAGLLLILAAAGLAQRRTIDGIPPRGDAAHYAASAGNGGVKVAAEIVGDDQVRNMFSTDLSHYIVVEVGVWPSSNKPLDLSAVDFSLRLESGRAPIRPVSARTIAGVLQRKGQSRRDDIVLFPTVGVTTGSWGTGTNVGVGVGMGGGSPGPAATDQDRRTMELELEEKGLPEAVVQKPVAGYLYFPAGSRDRKLASAELIYEGSAANLRFTLPVQK
jgi:hypothetical protein